MKCRSILAFVVLVLLCSSSDVFAQNVKFRWNAKTEKDAVKSYVKKLKKLPLTETQIKSISNCAKNKLKETYPNGINLSEQDFNQINEDFLTSCFTDLQLIVLPPLDKKLAETLTEEIQQKLPPAISESTKKKLGECFVAAVKQKYPNGFVFEANEKNEFQKQMYLLSSDCAEKMSFAGILSWNTDTETSFRYGLTKDYSKSEASAYATCFVAKLKIKYPSGYSVNEFNRKELNNAFEEIKKACIAELNGESH